MEAMMKTGSWLPAPSLLVLALALTPVAVPAAAEIAVRGRVVAVGGGALAGARVSLLPMTTAYEEAKLLLAGKAAPEPAAAATSGAGGEFEVAAPAAGMFRVRVETAGFVAQELALTPLVEELDLPQVTLPPDRGLKVRVTGPGGEPLAGAWVKVGKDYLTGGPFFRRFAEWQAAPRLARTDDHGVALLARSEGEALELSVDAPGLLPVEREGVRSPLLEVSLAAGSPRRLVVREEGRRPLAGVLLRLGEWRWPVGLTGDDGELSWRGPAGAADLFLETDDGRFRRLRRPAPEPHGPPNTVDLPAAPGHLAGRVVDGLRREPLPGAVVWWGGDEGHWTSSDPRGGYSLPANSLGVEMMMLAAAPGYQRTWIQVGAGAPAPTLALLPAAAVAGTVVDEAGGVVAGAELTLRIERPPRSLQRRLTVETRRSAVSSAAGRFRFAGLAPDFSYRLTAKATGYAPAELAVSDLEPYASRGGLRLVLQRGRRAWGRVVDGDGAPVPGATVRFEPASPQGPDRIRRLFRGSEEPAFAGAADETGRFEVAGLPAGRFDLTARAPGFAAGVVPGIEIPEGAGSVEVGTVELAPGVAVEGRVVDRRGQPLAGVEVRAQAGDPSGMMWAFLATRSGPPQAVTAADGWFSVADRRRGEKVDLVFNGPGHAATRLPGVEVPPEAPLEVVLDPLSTISGRLLDPKGDPIAGGWVIASIVRRSGSGASASTVFASMPGGSAPSDDEGGFVLSGIEPGSVKLDAQAPGRQPATLGEVEVAPGQDLEGVEIVLPPAAAVAGTVVGPDGQPAVGVEVQQVSERGDERSFFAESFTDGDGRYRLDGVAPGARRFMASDEDHPHKVAELEVAPGENRLDFQLEGGWEVSGRVVDEGGAPLAGIAVTLYSTGTWSYHPAVSGPDGAFAVAGLVDGTYRLRAGQEGYFQVDADQQVTVAGAPVAGVEVRMGTGGAITGHLLGLSFDDLARVAISAGGAARGSRGAASYDGTYRVAGLGPGSWRVSAEIPGSGRRAEGSVTLGPGAEEATLDLDFGAGLTLSGRVTADGEPLAAVTVEVEGLERESRASVATDHAGAFAVESLEAGRYRLSVFGGSGVLDEREIDLDDDREVEIRLRLGDVRGRVVDAADSSPVAGAEVRLDDQGETAAPWWRNDVRSDSAGSFALHGVPAGVHRLVAEKAGYAPGTAQVEVGPEEGAERVELRLTATAGLTLTVTTAAGAPVEAVRVALLDGAGRTVAAGSYLASEGGRVRISTAPPGAWTALVAAGDLAVVEVPVVVPGPPVAVSLPPGGRVAVTVPALAATSARATLTLARPDGRPFRIPYWADQLRSEWPLAGGEATVGGLEPGTWNLTVTAGDGRTWSGTATVTPGGTAEVSLE
jgi:5-hydroxyisourate hydrolase-like protein (transthyretin family)